MKKFISAAILFVIFALCAFAAGCSEENAEPAPTEATKASFVSTTTTASTAASHTDMTTEQTTTTTSPPDVEMVMVTVDAAVIRKGAKQSSDSIATVKYGTTFEYLGKSGKWYKIKHKGKTAYINTSCAKLTVVREYDTAEEINYLLSDTGERYNAVAIQVAAVRGSDGKSFTWNYGYSNKGDGILLTEDSKIRNASISKVPLAVTAMKMQEEGKLDIKCKGSKYLPSAGDTTILQYLTHTAKGSWSYSNGGINKCGKIMEYALGDKLDTYAKENIFYPLSMDASFFSGDINEPEKLATLYYENSSPSRSADTLKGIHSAAFGKNSSAFAGGFTSSAKDTCKLFSMLANDGVYDGVRILSAESVKTMEKAYLTAKYYGGKFSQCLVLRKTSNYCGCKTLYYHTGNACGVLGLGSYDPDTKTSVVVLATGVTDQSCAPYSPPGTRKGRDSQGVYGVASEIAKVIYKNIDKF